MISGVTYGSYVKLAICQIHHTRCARRWDENGDSQHIKLFTPGVLIHRMLQKGFIRRARVLGIVLDVLIDEGDA